MSQPGSASTHGQLSMAESEGIVISREFNGFQLRPHQQRAIEELRAGFKAGHVRQILVSPTGSGKTITAAHLARLARERGRVTLFIVDRIALADNAIEKLSAAGLNVSVVRGDESMTVMNHDVIVASIQSLHRRRYLPDADLLVIDEAHVLHKAHARLLERWSAVPCVGLTATPFTRGLGKYFSHLVTPTSVSELTEMGYLVPVVPYGPQAFDVSGVQTRAGDYAIGQLGQAVNRVELHADVVSTWQRLGEARPTLVFCVDIAHSKSLAAAFCSVGIDAEHLDGYQEAQDRRRAVQRFRGGQTTVLCSVACLSIGFDAPNASCLVLARPTKSLTLHLQQIGRGLRPDEGKADCVVIDHAGNIERHGLPADIGIGGLDSRSKTWQCEQRQERTPKPCPKCRYLKAAGEHTCPKCGFTPERQCEVVTRDAEIVALTSAAQQRDRRALYREFLGVAEALGKAPGWAFHLYRAKTGESPPQAWQQLGPLDPGPAAMSFAKHRMIRYAKGRQRAHG